MVETETGNDYETDDRSLCKWNENQRTQIKWKLAMRSTNLCKMNTNRALSILFFADFIHAIPRTQKNQNESECKWREKEAEKIGEKIKKIIADTTEKSQLNLWRTFFSFFFFLVQWFFADIFSLHFFSSFASSECYGNYSVRVAN